MKTPPPAADEDARLCALRELQVLDSPAEERFDRITRLAQRLFDVPIVLVSLVDGDRQWFKSRQGLDVSQTPRDVSFCGHAILGDDVLVVEDAHLDERFTDNPLVTGAPHVRFYAGHPLRTASGHCVGTLCLIDHRPREFSGEQRRLLYDLAKLVEAQLRQSAPVPGRPRDPSERRRGPQRRRHDALWQKLAKVFGRPSAALVPAATVAAIFLLLAYFWGEDHQREHHARERLDAAQAGQLLAAELEAALNRRFQLLHGLSGYVHAAPQFTRRDFQRFAPDLASGINGIRSLQLAPEGVVTFVWPRAGNEAAIGHDLFSDPARAAQARKAIASGRLWLAGPLDLIQGGRALIGRLPIFFDDEAEPGVRRFWGFATALIDVGPLLADARAVGSDKRFRYALRARDESGHPGQMVFGEPGLFDAAPVDLAVKLPVGQWDLAVVPLMGWGSPWIGGYAYRLLASLLAVLCGGLVYLMLRMPSSVFRSVTSATYGLERSEARFRDAIEAVPHGFALFDASEKFLLCNEQFRSMYPELRRYLQAGCARGALEARVSCRGVETEGPESADRLPTQEALPRIWHLEDGRVIRVVAARTRDGGQLSLHTDITQQQADRALLVSAREAAERANRAKSAFLATISHEVRTPLNGVLGLLGVLQADDQLGAKQKTYLDTALQSAEHLLSILNELLDLSKLEAERLEIDLGPMCVVDVLSDVARLMAAQAANKSIQLQVDADAELAATVLGDAGRLRQVVLNLVSNAVKFTDHGSVTIRGRATGASEDALSLRIEVVDTGIGFSQEDAGRLFQPFSQVDDSLRRRHAGTGLGLSICRRLVELMGGRIDARSVKGEGSTFTVELTLPRADSRLKAATEADSSDPGPVADVSTAEQAEPVRVLLAEDSSTNQLVIRAMLENTGYRVDAVSNGREALDALARLPYDLVLMDVQMPEMDGIEATRRIRAGEHAREVPIIALTANAMEGDAERFISAGMNDYLPKPVRRDRLLAMLKSWQRGRSMHSHS